MGSFDGVKICDARKHNPKGDKHSRFVRVAERIFYGNYFYGICTLSLILETVQKFQLRLDGIWLYVGAWAATLLFYNYPYMRYTYQTNHPRTLWFFRNRKWVQMQQFALFLVLALCFARLFMLYGEALRRLTIYTWGVVVVFPLMGICYYGSSIAGRRYSLRTIGWLKPFVIGFVWAGVVHIYPLWYASVIHVEKFEMNETSVLAFLQTFIFISMLAIIFDLKDALIDKETKLRTLVLRLGLQNTFLCLILPLAILLVVLVCLSYASIHREEMFRILLTVVPAVLLMISIRFFRKRRPLLY